MMATQVQTESVFMTKAVRLIHKTETHHQIFVTITRHQEPRTETAFR